MNEKRAKITFWITVISFLGSVAFALHVMFFGTRSQECEECIQQLIYQNHRADSLQYELDQLRQNKKSHK
jgi:Tfp pilus assembly protein PilN